LILCEKPMAAPEDPETCRWMVAAVQASRAIVLYDFPELFDDLTRRIEQFLTGWKRFRITGIEVTRSKDREDPANPRNYKRMVPIQYQESVHCLAFVLHVLGLTAGDWSTVFDSGVSVAAQAAPYAAPNPAEYPYVVDGACRFAMRLGGVSVTGNTNFKSGAAWTKRRVITGSGDERPFRIEAEYLEGHKRLLINGVDQQCDPRADSYRQVLETANMWRAACRRDELLSGRFPHPAFARWTYQLSSVLWRSSRDRREIRLRSLADLLEFDARFREEVPRLPRYSP
jgi:predicted dehydrogenase